MSAELSCRSLLRLWSSLILVGTEKRFSMSNITARATTTQQEKLFLKEVVLKLSIMIYQATLKAA